MSKEPSSVVRSPKKKVPIIDLSRCSDCQSCIEWCPEVFRKNQETGLLEVVDLPEYPEDKVDQAISLCPEDCIFWEECDSILTRASE